MKTVEQVYVNRKKLYRLGYDMGIHFVQSYVLSAEFLMQ